jgi:hypothetical protein
MLDNIISLGLKMLAPNKYQVFDQPEWNNPNSGKISASSQPGYYSGSSKDKMILKELSEYLANNPDLPFPDDKKLQEMGVDDALINDLNGLYNQGVRVIYSLANFPSDRDPQLLKLI